MPEPTAQDAGNGAGLAAYQLVLELIGLLEGMGVERETVTELMMRARRKAEGMVTAVRNPVTLGALQLLDNLVQQRRDTPQPHN